MDQLAPDRLIIVALFLGAMLILWAYVMRLRTALSARLQGGRRLLLRESLPLGEGRAVVIEAEGRRVLVVTARRATPALMDLGPVAPATPAQETAE